MPLHPITPWDKDVFTFPEWQKAAGAGQYSWTPSYSPQDAYNDYLAVENKSRAATGRKTGGGGGGGGAGAGVKPAGSGAGGGGGPGGGTTGGGGGGAAGSFNLNPAPRGGNGPYGLVPGALGLPDPHGDLKKVLPNLDDLNGASSSAILDQLGGKLSPATIAALTNMAAERGVAGGMPGAQTWDHLLLGNVAGATEELVNRGVTNYNSYLPTVSRTQTVSPELQTDIANTNAINAAAPDPTAQASEAERLWNKYKNSIGAGGGSRGGGGPGAGTRSGGLPPMPTFNQPNTTTGTGGGWGGPPPAGSPAPQAAGPNENWKLPGVPDFTKWDSIFDFGPPANPAGGTKVFNGGGPTTDPTIDDWMNEYNQWSF